MMSVLKESGSSYCTAGVRIMVPCLKRKKHYELLVTSVTSAFERALLQVTEDLQMKKHNPQNCRKEIH